MPFTGAQCPSVDDMRVVHDVCMSVWWGRWSWKEMAAYRTLWSEYKTQNISYHQNTTSRFNFLSLRLANPHMKPPGDESTMNHLRRLREKFPRKWRKSKLTEAMARDHELAVSLEDEMLEEAQTQRRQYPELRLGVDDINERHKMIALDNRIGGRRAADACSTRSKWIG